ncbi:MAG TPA: hypothetical protein PLA90_17680, partial [Candidatus Sumerlaeota bacterium]|nr:hypothetical protein [Candidatus Sumerlaeota bacterium]
RLYYGVKGVCVSLGGLACLLGLGVVLVMGRGILSSLSEGQDEGTGGIGIVAGLLFSEIAFLMLIACLSFPLLRRFKEVSPAQSYKMAIILGIAVWCLLNPILGALGKSPSYLAWKKASAFGPHLDIFPLLFPLILGWGTYRLTYPVLFLIGLRLQDCDPKPENSTGPGEAPQGEGEAA